MKPRKLRMICAGVMVLLLSNVNLAGHSPAITHAKTVAAELADHHLEDQPYVVEYYYKARWGHAEEFIQLFRKNHFPVLAKQIDEGRINRVTGARPMHHGTEDGRWDYRVTIVWKNVQVAHSQWENEKAKLKELYPDQESFQKEEQRRFRILLAHWDLPIESVDLE